MKNVYKECPVLENERFLLRLLKEEDAKDLLKVYSDKKSLPYFNSDNCSGDGFYCDSYDKIKETIKYWLLEYDRCGFVRFSILDKAQNEAIGTIELFNRKSDDFFNNCGLLRLDLRHDYENENSIYDILTILIEESFDLFDCTSIATKAQSFAENRIAALRRYGFSKSDKKLIGHDKTEYGDYWITYKK